MTEILQIIKGMATSGNKKTSNITCSPCSTLVLLWDLYMTENSDWNELARVPMMPDHTSEFEPQTRCTSVDES
jgi:hypothetical protein